MLVCDLLGYRRVAHLEELPLPGGAAAIAEPWRTALGWSYALLGEDGLGRAARLLRSRAVAPDPSSPTKASPSSGSRSTPASTRRSRPAADGCSTPSPRSPACAIEITYEGQAAIELEMRSAAGGVAYPYGLDGEVEAAAGAARRGAGEWVAAHAAHAAHAGRPIPVSRSRP